MGEVLISWKRENWKRIKRGRQQHIQQSTFFLKVNAVQDSRGVRVALIIRLDIC